MMSDCRVAIEQWNISESLPNGFAANTGAKGFFARVTGAKRRMVGLGRGPWEGKMWIGVHG